MTQYDAGPGDWSDREWEVEERKPRSQAQRRRVTLPPWALLAILVGIIILLCVSLILIVNAIRGGGDEETPTPALSATVESPPTATRPPVVTPTEVVTQTPTATVVLPDVGATETPVFTEIAPGAAVIVQNTLGAGLNLRAEPSTGSGRVGNYRDGTALVVLDGPEEADGYVWWQLRAPDGKEGWGAADWLALKTE